MTKIIKPDQHLATYIYEKTVNPEANLVWKTYQKRLVDKVDRIVELAHGQRDLVKNEEDWKIVEVLVDFFANEWPNEFNEFKKSIPDIRHSRRLNGYSKDKEIKYVGAIPVKLMRIVKAIFPDQEWDKEFLYKFIKRFPLFKIGGEQNLS